MDIIFAVLLIILLGFPALIIWQLKPKLSATLLFQEIESILFLVGVLSIHGITLLGIFFFAWKYPNQGAKNPILTEELLHTIIMGSFSLLSLIGGFLFGKMKGKSDAQEAMTRENKSSSNVNE